MRKIWRVKMELYDRDGNWLSSTDITTDPTMPCSRAARFSILRDLNEIARAVEAAPPMPDDASPSDEELACGEPNAGLRISIGN